jgi:hypothetical protein
LDTTEELNRDGTYRAKWFTPETVVAAAFMRTGLAVLFYVTRASLEVDEAYQLADEFLKRLDADCEAAARHGSVKQGEVSE